MADSRAAGRSEEEQPSRRTIAIALPFLFWSAFGLFVAVHTYLSMLSHHHSLPRLLFYEQMATLFWALSAAPIVWLTKRHPLVPWRWSSGAVHAAAASAFSSAYVVWFTWLLVALRPFDERGIQDFSRGLVANFVSTFPLGVLVYAGTAGAVLAYDFYEASRQRALREAQLERELAQARLDALSTQLQPHFLFNALHTVSGLIRGQEPQAAISTLAGLSDLLRYSLDSRAGPEAPIRSEIEAVDGYLAIQRLRYGNRLTVSLDVDPGALHGLLPRLLLQPLVENAMRHGTAPAFGPWLRVEVRRSGDRLHIEIENGADGATGDRSGGLGIGLRSTEARLEQLYGGTAWMRVQRSADRFRVTIELPWRECRMSEVAGA